MRTLMLGLILATVSFAADVVGKWTGTVIVSSDGGEQREHPALVMFKMEGDKLVGSIGPDEDGQRALKNIKLDGNKLTFEVLDGDVSAKGELQVSGDSMKGEAKAEQDGRKMVAKFDLKRQ